MRRWIALASVAVAAQTFAQEQRDTSAPNLIAVLRESHGVELQRETLEPHGPVRAQLADGSDVEVETSWFRYVGDLHIRLVFDGPADLQSASPEDLDRLRLEPEQAVKLAVDNLRRTYGEPLVQPWQAGLMQVTGRADDLNSSYFMDRAFWQSLERQNPGGLVVAVPQRGGLLFAPASDETAVMALRFSAPALYAASRRSRVSSALYLFREGRWSMFQPPLPY